MPVMRRIIVAFILVLATMAAPVAAYAESTNTGTFAWFVGEDVGQVGGEWPPAVSYAADGSRIILSGGGTFSIGEGRPAVLGGGTYIIYDAGGGQIASGDWRLTRLGGFVDHGFDPAFGETFRGGELRAEVELDGVGTGRIWINCQGPESPPSSSGGVRVHVGATHFDEKDVHSPALFVRS